VSVVEGAPGEIVVCAMANWPEAASSSDKAPDVRMLKVSNFVALYDTGVSSFLK